MEYLNIILWSVFALVVVFTLLGMLAGFLKGFIKTTVKTIIKAALVVVFVFASPSIANALGNLNLSALNQSFAINGTTVSLTTPLETLANVITATGFVSPMNGYSVYEVAMALALSLLSYVVFLVCMILTQILISLITALVYNVFLRWFLPVDTKKRKKARIEAMGGNKQLAALTDGLIDEDGNMPAKKKPFSLHRGAGAILGAAQEFVFVCTLLAPMTALARTAIATTKSDNKDNYGNLYKLLVKTNQVKDTNRPAGDTSNNIYKDDYEKIISSIESSWIYNLLGVYNYDTLLMNQVSQINVGSTSLSFASVIQSAMDVASPLLDSDAVDFNENLTEVTLNYALLLGPEMIQNLLEGILGNQVLVSLIPPLIDVALNYASSSTSVAVLDLDFSDIDWSDSLKAISEIYTKIYSSGNISSIFSADGKSVTIDNYSLKVSEMTDAQITEIASAVSSLAEVDVVKNNLASVMAGVGTYLKNTGYDVLPTSADEYSSVTWSKDLSNIITNVLKTIRLLGLDIDKDLFTINTSDPQSGLIRLVKDMLKDETKRATFEGYLTSESEGILSTSIMNVVNLGNIADSLLSNVSSLSKYTSSDAFTSACELLNRNPSAIKNELTYMFRICDILLDENMPFNYWTYTDLAKLYSESDRSAFRERVLSLVNDDVCDELVSLLGIAEKSSLFDSMYASIIKTFVFSYYNGSSTEVNYLFGLTPYDFDYDAENFTESLKKIIKLAPGLKNLYDALNGGKTGLSVSERIDLVDTDVLADFLYAVTGEDTSGESDSFFNPTMTDASSNKDVANRNVHTILENLINTQFLSTLGLTLPSVSEMSDIRWGTERGDDYEISLLMDTIDELKKNKDVIVAYVQNGKKITLSLLSSINTSEEREAIIDLLDTAIQSDIARPVAVELVADKLQAYLDRLGIPFSINDLRTYAYKDENLGKIREDLENIKNLLPLLNKINWHYLYQDIKALRNKDYDRTYYFKSIETDDLNAIATTLFNTNTYQYLCDASGSDYLTEALYAVLEGTGLFTSESWHLVDYGSYYLNPENSGESWSSDTSTVTLEGINKVLASDGTYVVAEKTSVTVDITTEGEIYNFGLIFDFIKKADLSMILQKKWPPLGALDGWLSDDTNLVLFGDAYFRQLAYIYLPYLINTALEKVTQIPVSARTLVDSIDFSLLTRKDANGNFYFTAEEFRAEAVTAYHILQNVKRLGRLSSLPSLLKDPFNLTENQKQRISNIISLLSQSQFLTTVKEGHSLSPLSEALYLVCDRLTTSYDLFAWLTLDDNTTTNKAKARAMLQHIDETGDWANELSNLYDALMALQSVDLDQLSPFATNYSYDVLYDVFESFNKSYLLHRAPIYLLKTGIADFDISTILEYPLDFNVHLTNSQEDQEYWMHDYELILDLIYNDGSIETLNIANFKFDTVKTSYLYYIGSMNIFKENRAYILLNLIENYDSSYVSMIFKQSSNTPYGEDSYAYRLEDLFFNNSELMTNGVLDKEKAIYDTTLLDKTIDTVLSSIEALSTATSFADLNISSTFFTELTSACLAITSGNDLYRSKLASELVAGALTALIQNENLSEYFGELRNVDFYADDYALVNPVEGRFIDSIIALAKNAGTDVEFYSYEVVAGVTQDFPYYSKEVLMKYMPYFGSDTNAILGESEDSENIQALLDYFLSVDYATNKNSILAMMVANATNSPIGILPVFVLVDETDPDAGMTYMTLSSAADFASLSTTSFDDLINALDLY